MLDHLRGEALRVAADSAVIAVGGVGIRVHMPTPDLAGLEGTVTVFTVLQIRDDEVQLYGFASERGREVFRALTTVNGVGPRLALAVLSFHGAGGLDRVLAGGDADALALVPGVGKKKAQRIALELRDKLVGSDPPAATGTLAEVREGLRELGFSAQEAQDATADLPTDGDTPTLLRHALKALGAREAAGADR